MAYDVQKLPRDLRRTLEAAGRGESTAERPALSLEGTVGKWILLVVGLVLGVLPCLYILDYRRMLPLDEMSLCAAAAVLGWWMVASALGRLLRYYRSAARPVMVLGPDSLAIVESVGGAADIFPVADITRITLQSGAWASIDLKDRPTRQVFPTTSGQPLIGFFEEVQKRRAERLQAPLPEGSPDSWHAVAEGSGAAHPPTWSPSTSWGLHLTVLLCGVGLAGAAVFLSWRTVGMRIAVDRYERARAMDTVEAYQDWLKTAMHASRVLAPSEELPKSVTGRWGYGRGHTHVMLRTTPFVENLGKALARYDALSYQAAAEAGTAAALRGYLDDFSQPAHREEAEAALRALYEQAEARYLERATARAGVKEAPREGMLALLHALSTGDLTVSSVGVSFLPVKGLESGKLEDAMQEATGAKTVYPVGPSFSKEANEARHSKIVDSLNRGFEEVVGDLFTLEERPLDAPGPRILVGYTVLPSGNHFFSKSQATLPPEQREVYVGIVVAFACTIQTPGPGEVASQDPDDGHKVMILASPAPDFSVSARRYTPMQKAVYDRMAETAFRSFSEQIAAAYGIGVLKEG